LADCAVVAPGYFKLNHHEAAVLRDGQQVNATAADGILDAWDVFFLIQSQARLENVQVVREVVAQVRLVGEDLGLLGSCCLVVSRVLDIGDRSQRRASIDRERVAARAIAPEQARA
jgi:hypothetical protein